MACPHFDTLPNLRPPKLSEAVNREECTQCFDNQDLEIGVDVCLTCFNGGCLGEDRHHAQTHAQKRAHNFSLNVKRTRKAGVERTDEEPPMKKLAIREDNEAEKYVYSTTLRCWGCAEEGRLIPEAMNNPQIKALSDAVLASASSARQSEVKAWEEDIHACEHTLLLSPDPAAANIPVKTHCTECELGENLWLCMSCGNVGCGRKQFGGVGGNGHGVGHFEKTGHEISVKLGTITPEGTADVFCYVHNDSVLDESLASHLIAPGIPIATQQKTAQSTTEMQIEHNLKFDFSLLDASGEALEPVTGPGLTGLQNLGNSCYMASVMQVLFALKAWRLRYLPTARLHPLICPQALPAECVDCQLHKMADGLLSGRYSHPRTSPDPANVIAPKEGDPVFQEGLRPAGFKTLVGKGHEEFGSMRQQDSEEFLGHLLKITRQWNKRIGSGEQAGEEPTEVFRFGIEQRLQCTSCHRVRYRVDESDVASVPVMAIELGPKLDAEGKPDGKEYREVALEECIGALMGTESVEFHCESCGKTTSATKTNRFASFPDTLVVQARKFQLIKWVPTKLDIPVVIRLDDMLTLDVFQGHGQQANEESLPDSTSTSGAQAKLPEFNPEAMAQLEGMGFPTVRCQKALLATGNEGGEAAMEWLFAHMEDPDIDDPIVMDSNAKSGPEPSAEQISMLADMGFTSAQAKKALKETDGNPERAVEWLFSHPDDDGSEAPQASSQAPAGSSGPPAKIAGSTSLPAKYRLRAFISHKGTSVHSGHYVAHILMGNEGWVLFNDEKVVKADEESVRELKKLAYLYVFEKA